LLALLAYVYAGYPLAVIAVSRMRRTRRAPQTGALPSVSILVAARNEERSIGLKIENTLELAYPRGLLQIIVVSDASTDRTEEIVRGYADRGILLQVQDERKGKTAALNATVRLCTGELLMLSDATTMLEPDALRRIVAHFADPSVGLVSGKILYANSFASGISAGEGLYQRYEEAVKKAESDLGILALAHGPFYVIRRGLFPTVPTHLADDCASPLHVARSGFGVLFDPLARAWERAATTARGEIRIKTRGAVRDLEGTLRYGELLNPLRRPALAWSLLSHKLLRWFAAAAFPLLLIANVALIERPPYAWLLAAQGLFYVLALTGSCLTGRTRRVLQLPHYFCVVQIAALGALGLWLRGIRKPTWEPVR
jgi:cellulose synthase/poly-beta-1,6-N-acetylglucosamine synthase-like glycosyltransferase